MSNDGVIIQTLRTLWTKEFRGAPASSRRNATPETLALDPSRFSVSGVTWHDVSFGEPEFTPVEAYRDRNLPCDFHRVSVLVEGHQVLAVQLFGKSCFRLHPGQTGTVLYNLSDDVIVDGWRNTEFNKVVFHIAFAIAATPDIFRRAPDHRHSSMRDLT